MSHSYYNILFLVEDESYLQKDLALLPMSHAWTLPWSSCDPQGWRQGCCQSKIRKWVQTSSPGKKLIIFLLLYWTKYFFTWTQFHHICITSFTKVLSNSVITKYLSGFVLTRKPVVTTKNKRLLLSGRYSRFRLTKFDCTSLHETN